MKVVSVSARWAEMAMWLRAYPNNKQYKRKVRDIVEDYSDCEPEGEGGVVPAHQLAGRIDQMSRFPVLEKE